jgi:hypothetical protein
MARELLDGVETLLVRNKHDLMAVDTRGELDDPVSIPIGNGLVPGEVEKIGVARQDGKSRDGHLQLHEGDVNDGLEVTDQDPDLAR